MYQQQPVQQQPVQQQNDQRNVHQQGRALDQQGPAQRQRTGEFQIQIADPTGNQVHVPFASISVCS